MKFEISHTTEYLYSSHVFFEPHYFRFKPKATSFSSIESYDININPKPSGFSDQVDTENNLIRLCWFEDLHQKLKIAVKTVIDVTEYNPFNFLVHPLKYLKIPFKYDNRTAQLLNPALMPSALSESINQFLSTLLKKSNNQTVAFLIELTKQIHNDFTVETRDEGEPFNPNYTFNEKLGSCRDLSWMQINMLRHLGIAARFVSGYFYMQADKPVFELHAWVEVFLPGAGWIGFDPSHGIITSCYHIPLASSAFYENTMPISGAIRGDATSILENDLNIVVVR